MVVIDSCVIISLFIRDKFHEKAKEAVELLQKKNAIAPSLLLPEVCGAIARVTKEEKLAKEVLKLLMKWVESGLLKLVEIDEKLAKEAAKMAMKYEIKGADAIFASLAASLDQELFTFDEKLKRKLRNAVKFY